MEVAAADSVSLEALEWKQLPRRLCELFSGGGDGGGSGGSSRDGGDGSRGAKAVEAVAASE